MRERMRGTLYYTRRSTDVVGGRDSAVSVSAWHRQDNPGFKPGGGKRTSIETSRAAVRLFQTALLTGNGFFARLKRRGRGVYHTHLAPRLRMSGAIPLFSLCASYILRGDIRHISSGVLLSLDILN